MADALTDRLLNERATTIGIVDSLKTAAAETGRDLSTEDLESITAAQERVRAIDKQLELVSDKMLMDEGVRERLAQIPGSTTQAAPPRYRSDGELLYDVLHQNEEASAARYSQARKRAAEHMGNLAADTTPVAGDLEGLAIQPIVGPTVNPYWSSAPFTQALGPNVIPAYTFERPYLVDDAMDTGVDAQGLQKAELASEKFDVESDILKGTTLGGYLNVSQQLLSLQAGSLGVILAQMRARMSRKIENFHLTELALSTGTIDLPAAATGDQIVQAIYDASANVATTTSELATMLVMGPLGWARLGGAMDLGGRPLLPSVAPQNAAGSLNPGSFAGGVAGLRNVVTQGITDDTFWVLNGMCIESWIYSFPVLEAIEPSVLGRQVAIASSVVAHRPTPTANSAIHLKPAA